MHVHFSHVHKRDTCGCLRKPMQLLANWTGVSPKRSFPEFSLQFQSEFSLFPQQRTPHAIMKPLCSGPAAPTAVPSSLPKEPHSRWLPLGEGSS